MVPLICLLAKDMSPTEWFLVLQTFNLANKVINDHEITSTSLLLSALSRKTTNFIFLKKSFSFRDKNTHQNFVLCMVTCVHYLVQKNNFNQGRPLTQNQWCFGLGSLYLEPVNVTGTWCVRKWKWPRSMKVAQIIHIYILNFDHLPKYYILKI